MKVKLMKKNLPTNKLIVIAGVVFLVYLLEACAEQDPTARLTVNDYPESNSGTTKLYLEKCGSCHAAPLPSIHTEKQWFGVVQRMQLRMTNKAIKPLDKQQLRTIVEYLQKYARKE